MMYNIKCLPLPGQCTIAYCAQYYGTLCEQYTWIHGTRSNYVLFIEHTTLTSILYNFEHNANNRSKSNTSHNTFILILY